MGLPFDDSRNYQMGSGLMVQARKLEIQGLLDPMVKLKWVKVFLWYLGTVVLFVLHVNYKKKIAMSLNIVSTFYTILKCHRPRKPSKHIIVTDICTELLRHATGKPRKNPATPSTRHNSAAQFRALLHRPMSAAVHRIRTTSSG